MKNMRTYIPILFGFYLSCFCIFVKANESFTSSDIVIGSNSFKVLGLEWMRWDITSGQSIETALGTYGGSGWRLASNIEMVDLLNGVGANSDYEPIEYDYDENTSQSSWDPAYHHQYDWLIDLVGYTSVFGYVDGRCDFDDFMVDGYGCTKRVNALFGEDGDNDDLYNMFRYSYTVYSDNSFSDISLSGDRYGADYAVQANNGMVFPSGVALVRDVTPMPWPSTFAMFLTGLCFLGVIARLRRKGEPV